MEAYSKDLRVRVLKDSEQGMGTREVALKYDVSESWVRRLKQRHRESGEITAREQRRGSPPKWLPYCDQIIRLVEEQPDITLRELAEKLPIEISTATLHRALKHLQLTFKKK